MPKKSKPTEAQRAAVRPVKVSASKVSAKEGAVRAGRDEHDDSAGVAALVEALKHPLRTTVEEVRRTILAAAPGITEGVKWNSPSFYCHGWFATIGSRKATQLDVVLHCGAKVRADCAVREAVEDKGKLLTWPSPDRALVAFTSEGDFRGKRAAFQRIIRGWVAYQKSQVAAE